MPKVIGGLSALAQGLALRQGASNLVLPLHATYTQYSKHLEKAFLMFYPAACAVHRHTQYNVHLEKACVMFNLGAVISQQGLACDRTTPDGLITASKHFQVSRAGFEVPVTVIQ
eukprot:scaffold228663_cov18-Tisochrysis_lutea.AAC.3